MHPNQIEQKLKSLAKKMQSLRVDMKFTQQHIFRLAAIRQQKNFYRFRGCHFKHWQKMGMRHLLTIRKNLKNIRTEVIALNALKKEAAK